MPSVQPLIVHVQDGREDVYLVKESKGDMKTLRDPERAQIACGKAHFNALKVPCAIATDLDGILAQV